MKTNDKKKCKRCYDLVPTLDKHDVCKPCRQPATNIFECPGKCQICEAVYDSPLLSHTLRKYELKRLRKKDQSSIPSSLIVSEKYNKSFKNGKTDEGFWKIAQPHLKTEESTNKTMDVHHNKNFSCGTNDTSSNDNSLSEINMKLSRLANCNNYSDSPSDLTNSASFSGQSLLQTNKPEVMDQVFRKFCNMLLQGVTIDSKENIVSNQGVLNTNIPEKHLDSLNSENKKEVFIKVSSKASDILLSSTILNSPLKADELRKKLKLDENFVTWPSDISQHDLLDIYENHLPGMKLLPKVRHLQKFLFGKLSPSLPQEIIASDFILPPISHNLESQFLFARKQLQRSLFMFSILDGYNDEQFKSNMLIKNVFEQLFCQLKDSIKTQGNLVGLLLHDIRKELLQEVTCQDNEAITKLIAGSVDENQFFGPYVKVLQSLVKNKGSSYCLRRAKIPNLNKLLPKPSLNLAKLLKSFEIGDSVNDFLKDLRSYFIINEISENDKVAVFETLLPSTIVDKITMFFNPANCTTKKNFDEMSIYFERVGSGSEKIDYLFKRFTFTEVKQEADQSTAAFAKELQDKISGCNYGPHEKEFLRDQFIFGLKDKATQLELLDKYYFSFEQCVTFASSKEIETREKSGKVVANNNNLKILQKESIKKEPIKKGSIKNESIKKEIEVIEQPLTTYMKKKVGTKEIVKLNENKLNEQKKVTHLKRKLETEENVKLPAKKVNLSENSFYAQYTIFHDKPKLEMIHVKSKQHWNSYFGTNAAAGYKVLCPWTGKILRAK